MTHRTAAMDADGLTQAIRDLQSAVESLTMRVATLEANSRPRSATAATATTPPGPGTPPLIELPTTSAPIVSSAQPQKGVARALTSRFAR